MQVTHLNHTQAYKGSETEGGKFYRQILQKVQNTLWPDSFDDLFKTSLTFMFC